MLTDVGSQYWPFLRSAARGQVGAGLGCCREVDGAGCLLETRTWQGQQRSPAMLSCQSIIISTVANRCRACCCCCCMQGVRLSQEDQQLVATLLSALDGSITGAQLLPPLPHCCCASQLHALWMRSS